MSKKKTCINQWLDKQAKKTKREIHRQVSRDELLLLTCLSFVVAGLQISSMLMNMYNWANTPGVDFGSYHLYAPVVALCGWCGYTIVLLSKRVQVISMLPFVPSAIGIFYNSILTLIRFDIIGPEILKIW